MPSDVLARYFITSTSTKKIFLSYLINKVKKTKRNKNEVEWKNITAKKKAIVETLKILFLTWVLERWMYKFRKVYKNIKDFCFWVYQVSITIVLEA